MRKFFRQTRSDESTHRCSFEIGNRLLLTAERTDDTDTVQIFSCHSGDAVECRLYLLNSGMLTSIMPNTATNRIGIVTRNTMAHFTLTVNAITTEPNTINGLRSSRRRPMLIPFCTWLISLIRRVISVSVPMVSSSVRTEPGYGQRPPGEARLHSRRSLLPRNTAR